MAASVDYFPCLFISNRKGKLRGQLADGKEKEKSIFRDVRDCISIACLR